MKFTTAYLFSILFFSSMLLGNKEGDFVSLYNGKDLSGWKTTGNWLPQKDGSLLINQNSSKGLAKIFRLSD